MFNVDVIFWSLVEILFSDYNLYSFDFVLFLKRIFGYEFFLDRYNMVYGVCD